MTKEVLSKIIITNLSFFVDWIWDKGLDFDKMATEVSVSQKQSQILFLGEQITKLQAQLNDLTKEA